MKKKKDFTKILAILGTIAVGFTVLAPTVFSILFFIQAQAFRFDYLMPAELFPLALAGGILLFWAAFRAEARRKLIGWSLAAAVALLAGVQAVAVVSGLASGERAPEGIWFVLVILSLAGYVLAVIAMGVGGVLLLGDQAKNNFRNN